MKRTRGSREGSAMVESCVVMMLLCLVLFGLLQTSYLVGIRNVIRYTAVATARSAAIGLNDFMLYKVSHFTSIAAAGPVRTPQGIQAPRPKGATLGMLWDRSISRSRPPQSSLGDYELSVREAYHLAGPAVYDTILDYDNWQRDETDLHYEVVEDPKEDLLHVSVNQNVPMVFPFSNLFFGHQKSVLTARGKRMENHPAQPIHAEVTIEDHSKLYLLDE